MDGLNRATHLLNLVKASWVSNNTVLSVDRPQAPQLELFMDTNHAEPFTLFTV